MTAAIRGQVMFEGMRQSRREFLRFSGLGVAGALLPSFGAVCTPLKPLSVRREVLDAGAEKLFSVLHVSDSHLSRIDSRDGEGLYSFAKSRSRIGRELGEYYLDEAVHFARSMNLKLIHTGDFMDFASEANIEYARRRFHTDDFLACPGNHEFWIDAAHGMTEEYKSLTASRLGKEWSGLPASVRRMNGINFFAFDNSSETVTQEVAVAFERVLEENRPVVMVCHVPLWAEGCGIQSHVCGKPGNRKGDDISCAFVEKARKSHLVRAVLSGHLHKAQKFAFSPTATEYVAGALFNGDSTRIDIS